MTALPLVSRPDEVPPAYAESDYRSKEHVVDERMLLMRAVAAIAVCVGHVSSLELSGPFGLFPPYSYQIAAFVFISGYFYNRSAESDLRGFLARKARRLLVPLVAINAAYGVLGSVLEAVGGFSCGEALSVRSLLVDPIVLGTTFPLVPAMWFLGTFFFCEMAYVLVCIPLRRLLGNFTDGAVFVTSLVVGGLVVVRGGADGMPLGLELSVCRVLFFLPWFSAGRLYRTTLERHDTLPNCLVVLTCVVGQLLVTVLAREPVVYNSAWCRFYHGPVLTYVTTFLSLAFVLRLSRICAPLLGQMPVLRAIGENSFSVMCHHQMGFLATSLCLAGAHYLFGVFRSFDIAALRAAPIGYFVFPGGLSKGAVLYVIGGIGFSLIVHAVWRSAREALRRRAAR